MIRALLITLALAAPAAAQELRPTPAYFAQTIFDSSMAQALAQACGTVSVDPGRAAERGEALLIALQEDGFSPTEPQTEMIDPDAAIRSLQEAFVARYALDSPDEARVCEIARAEMDAETGLGLLLVEVAQ